MIQTLTIPGEFPTLNSVLAATKRHWSLYSTTKRQMTTKASYIAKRNLRPIDGPVDLEFEWTAKSKRIDPDNISHGAKYVIDGLVQAGILSDDSRKVVRSLSHTFPPPDRKHPRVVVTLRDDYEQE